MSCAGGMGSWHQGRAALPRRDVLRCCCMPADALGFSWQRVPSMGSTSLGGVWVLEPRDGGDGAVFQLGNGSGHCRSLPLSALHEEEWCAVFMN